MDLPLSSTSPPGGLASISAADIFLVSPDNSPSQEARPKDSDLADTDRIFWQDFGFVVTGQDSDSHPERLFGKLPPDTIALHASSEGSKGALTAVLAAMSVPPLLSLTVDGGRRSLYRVAEAALVEVIRSALPTGVIMTSPGDVLPLPDRSNWTPEAQRAKSLSDLSVLAAENVAALAAAGGPALDRVSKTNPLLPFSLRGAAAAFEKDAKEAKPLLGGVCMSGQATIWYAPPNAGKTLLTLNFVLDAVAERRIEAGNVFYINADDSSSGLASKLRMMDDLGAHTLVPGFKGFKAPELITLLRTAASQDEARGILIIIDTVKKFASLMDKKDSSAFADACRQFVMRGGSILALAHTAKNRNPDGGLRYAGTTDLLEDFDAGYLLSPLNVPAEAGERVVQFDSLKRRADSPDTVAYAYAAESGISYDERIASVRVVDLDQLGDFKKVAQQHSDAEVIEAIVGCIGEGVAAKMALSKAAAKKAGVSERAVIKILEQYAGSDPEKHRWTFSIKSRGAKVFELLPPVAT